MFREHFGMHSDPFKLGPSLRFLYGSKAHEETIAHLVFGIEQGEDFILISGDIGTGKTLALHYLIEQISASFVPIFINVTQLNSVEFLKLVLSEAGCEVKPGGDIADYLAQFKIYLQDTRRQAKKVLLLVDEAQDLDAKTLEGVRLLTNLCQPGGQVLQIVLAGQPGLEETINLTELQQLRQRIRVHYRLEHLSRKELDNYISHRLKVAGCKKNIFKKQAIDKIFQACKGVPRLVNVLASKALVAAFADGAKTVRARHVEFDSILKPTGEPTQTVAPKLKTVESSEETKQSQPGLSITETQADTQETESTTEASSLSVVDSHRTMSEPVEKLEELDALDSTPPQGPSESDPTKTSRSHKKSVMFCVWAIIISVAVYLVWFDDIGIISNLSQRFQGVGQAPAVANHTQIGDQTNVPPETNSSEDDADRSPNLTPNPVADSAEEFPEPNGTSGNSEFAAVSDDISETAAITPAIEEPVSAVAEWAVHVASFRQLKGAADFATVINTHGYMAYVESQVIHGQKWQRVYVGPFANVDEAEDSGQKIKDLGLASYFMVVRYKK